MDSKPDPHTVHNGAEPSLIRGGPFYRAQLAIRLIRPDKWNVSRRVTLAVIIGWLPLVVITAVLNFGGLVSLLRDYRVYSRMLIAVPVLLLGEGIMESRFKTLVGHFSAADLLDLPDIERMNSVINTLTRVRDSALPELAILLLLIIHTATAERGLVDATPWLGHGTGDAIHLTAAGWYAVLVSVTLFQFLLGLALWKWVLWTYFAFRLSRLNLKLIPTHPDEHGGLGFLGMTPTAFTPAVFAATTVIGATWRHEMLAGRANLMTFKFPAIVLLCIIAIVALFPLIFFIPRLAELRHRGILQYGILAQLQSKEFHEKWIRSRAGDEAELLTAPECTALSNFGNIYERLRNFNPFPVDKEALVPLGLSVLIPSLPVVLAAMPLMVVLKVLLKAIH